MKIWEQMQKTAPSTKIEAKSLDQKNKMLQEENVNLRSEAYKAKAECSIKTAEADSLKNQLKYAQLEIEKLKVSNNKMRDICAYFEKQLQEKDNTFSVIISEFKKTHERLKHDLKLAQERYADDKTKLNKMLEIANAENKNLKNKIEENNTSIQAMCSQLNAIKQEKASEMQQREQNYKKAIQKLDSEKKYAETQIHIKNNQLQSQKNLLFQEKKDMAWEITKLNKVIKERTIAISKTKDLYNQKNQKLQFYSSEKIKELESSLNDLRKELDFKKHKENLSNEKLATLNRQLNENEKFINEFSENFKKQELLLQKLKEEKVRVLNKSSVKISAVKTPINQAPVAPARLSPDPISRSIKWMQVYYNEDQKAHIKEGFTPYKNETATIFLESQIMKDLFLQGKHKGYDLFGVCSWKMQQKFKKIISFQKNQEKINQQYNDFDVFTLDLRTHVFPSVRKPHFTKSIHREAHKSLLQFCDILIEHGVIERFPSAYLEKNIFIYCNYFLAKPSIFEGFMKELIIPSIDLMKLDKKANKIALKEGKYDSRPPKNFIADTGLNYYPMAPFVLERLINVYIAMKSLKVGFIL